MLSRSRGQYLCMAATLHVLFNWKTPHNIPVIISNEALKAADSFVTMCVLLQHASYLAGRGELSEAIENVNLLQQVIFSMLLTLLCPCHSNYSTPMICSLTYFTSSLGILHYYYTNG